MRELTACYQFVLPPQMRVDTIFLVSYRHYNNNGLLCQIRSKFVCCLVFHGRGFLFSGFYGIVIAEAIITVPTLPPKKQGRHFAGRRKPVETQPVFYGIIPSVILGGIRYASFH